MKILEFEAKVLLAGRGLRVPAGQVVSLPEEASAVARRLGRPVVIKAQVPASGRMLAGGIRFAVTPAEAETAVAELLDTRVRNFPVDTVLVEERLDSVAEIYVGVTYDGQTQMATLLATRGGGVEVEDQRQFLQRPFSMLTVFPGYLSCEVAEGLGFEGRALVELAAIMTQLARCFASWDATLLEINPLILSRAGQWFLADAHLELDDEAVYRQPGLLAQAPSSVALSDRRSSFERQAEQIDSADHRGVAGRLVPFDGDLGLLIGGGGASLTIMDAVLDAGLKPANYCEIGGNPSVWKIKELTKLILRQPQVKRLAVIMNVVSNTRADLIARGVIKGILELNLDPRSVLVAFRVPGSWEMEGQAVLQHYGVPSFGRQVSIDQVIEAIRGDLGPG